MRGRFPQKGHDMGQETIPGTLPEKDEQIHGLAIAYAELRDGRMALGRDEAGKKAELHSAMKAKDLETYNVAGVSVDITKTEDIKVKVAKTELEPAKVAGE